MPTTGNPNPSAYPTTKPGQVTPQSGAALPPLPDAAPPGSALAGLNSLAGLMLVAQGNPGLLPTAYQGMLSSQQMEQDRAQKQFENRLAVAQTANVETQRAFERNASTEAMAEEKRKTSVTEARQGRAEPTPEERATALKAEKAGIAGTEASTKLTLARAEYEKALNDPQSQPGQLRLLREKAEALAALQGLAKAGAGGAKPFSTVVGRYDDDTMGDIAFQNAYAAQQKAHAGQDADEIKKADAAFEGERLRIRDQRIADHAAAAAAGGPLEAVGASFVSDALHTLFPEAAQHAAAALATAPDAATGARGDPATFAASIAQLGSIDPAAAAKLEHFTTSEWVRQGRFTSLQLAKEAWIKMVGRDFDPSDLPPPHSSFWDRLEGYVLPSTTEKRVKKNAAAAPAAK